MNLHVPSIDRTLDCIAHFYDNRKYGYAGFEGYRKSTDLYKFIKCAKELERLGLINHHHTAFLDLGCADGRVNVLMSYFVKKSIGIEIDRDILSEYGTNLSELSMLLAQTNLCAPPDNIHLVAADSLEAKTYQTIREESGIGFEQVDLFYTYITLHDLFAEKIIAEAKAGALYMVYGFNRILPSYDGLEVLLPDVASQGIAALYKK